jgi:hypothetical protein
MKILKGGIALVAAALSSLYLANVGAGVVELIPDNIPFAGNLDEFIASLILIRSLAYLGLNVSKPETHTITQ